MRTPLVLLLVALLAAPMIASAAQSYTRSYQGWTTRYVLTGEPIVDCQANGNGVGGACFPVVPGVGRALVSVRPTASGPLTAAMIWAYIGDHQVSGDVVCLAPGQSHWFFYNTGATRIVVGVGAYFAIGNVCASTGTPYGEITVAWP